MILTQYRAARKFFLGRLKKSPDVTDQQYQTIREQARLSLRDIRVIWRKTPHFAFRPYVQPIFVDVKQWWS